MPFESTVRLLKLDLTYEQTAACRYLESKGLRFCVDFGYDNAFEKAFQTMESEAIN